VATVQLFVTCLVDGFAPEVGRATVRVLERAGCEVAFPEKQTCCGQPAFNAGYGDEAGRMAAATVQLLDRTEGPIVLPSGSCADMLVHHAPELLAGTALDHASRRVAARVRELTQYLVDDLGIDDLGVSHACTAVYHPSCHGLRNLGLRAKAETLLDAVDGLERLIPDEAEQCCGFGGLFAIEMPDVSAEILRIKLDQLEATGAEVVVGGDLSCLLHIEGGLRRRNARLQVRHIAQILEGPDPS
jgi:L-lactate dehydrogenase complex protein LldE